MIRLAAMANSPNHNTGMTSTGSSGEALMHERIVAALKTVYDPEIPVNIFDLGLIYDIDISDEGSVHIRMTLTAPACPVAGSMPGIVAKAVEKVVDVAKVDVELVWDPPWSQERMTDEARLALGMYE